MINIEAAWVGFFLGCVSGAIPGLFFYRKDWLGGYTSWKRRMVRLAHISFFGIGFLNLSFALTARSLELTDGLQGTSVLLIVGAATMPTVCYLAAWKPALRNLFCVPAGSVSMGIALLLWRIFSV